MCSNVVQVFKSFTSVEYCLFFSEPKDELRDDSSLMCGLLNSLKIETFKVIVVTALSVGLENMVTNIDVFIVRNWAKNHNGGTNDVSSFYFVLFDNSNIQTVLKCSK